MFSTVVVAVVFVISSGIMLIGVRDIIRAINETNDFIAATNWRFVFGVFAVWFGSGVYLFG